MDTPLVASVITIAGTLIVSLAGSYFGSRLARRSGWADRVSDALPKFYAAATVAWYAWQRYATTEEPAPQGDPGRSVSPFAISFHRYYEEYISSYKELLTTATTLVLLLPPDRRQAIWDLLDLWEEPSDPRSSGDEDRWMTKVHELVGMVLELLGKTAPPFPGASPTGQKQ